MNRWDKNTFLAAWKVETDRFRQAVATEQWDRKVPSCPEWTVDVLTAHVSDGFRIVAERVVTTEAPQDGPKTDTTPVMPDTDPLTDFDSARQELSDAMESVSLDAPAWNFAPSAKTARFWFRRILCETAVHRWDAQRTAGDPEPIEAATACEGITEVFDTFLPMASQRNPSDVTGLTHLVATDSNREWFLRMRSGRPALLEAGSLYPNEITVQSEARGGASALLLALWGREVGDELTVSGDTALFDALRIG